MALYQLYVPTHYVQQLYTNFVCLLFDTVEEELVYQSCFKNSCLLCLETIADETSETYSDCKMTDHKSKTITCKALNALQS